VLIALNLAALILVLGITWVGMIWLSGRVHPPQPEDRDPVTGLPADPLLNAPRDGDGDGDECSTCNGVGAESRNGRLVPCPACLGRGVS